MKVKNEIKQEPIYHAYIDEFGDTNIDISKNGVSKTFIVAALIVRSDKIDQVRTELNIVRSRYFQKGEMKSSGIKNKHNKRRLSILKELLKSDFSICCFIAEKDKIFQQSGLRFKRSFFKFMNNKLYTELLTAFDPLLIIADEHGSNEYMNGFRRYVDAQIKGDLFDQSGFGFKDSKNDVLLQAADFIGGTIARLFDPDKIISQKSDFKKLLDSKNPYYIKWPSKQSDLTKPVFKTTSKQDNIIRKYAVKRAIKYVEDYGNKTDEFIQLKVKFVRDLLMWLNFDDFVNTTAILNSYLRDGVELSKHMFRTQIVAKLRDDGVFIASSSKGYKIPTTIDDVTQYVKHFEGKAIPMLERLHKSRKQISLVTEGEIDILDHAKSKITREIMDSIRDQNNDN